MSAYSSLPARRRTALVLNLFIIGLLWLLVLTSLAVGESGYLSLMYIMLALPFVALFQYACVIYNVLKGSKLQLWYLIGSLVFLVVYFGSIYGFIDYFDNNDEEMGILLLTVTPVICATIFCFILYIDHPDGYQREEVGRDTLDGGLDLF